MSLLWAVDPKHRLRVLVPVLPPAADVLLTQGVRDTLFNYNDGYNNYQCMKSLGGDVRLFTHQSGDLLPAVIPADAQGGADQRRFCRPGQLH